MKFGLIGHPVGHSYSKIIHGMMGNQEYEVLDLEADEVEDFLKKKDFDGINVTLPYKEAVLSCLDEVEEQAKEIHAVNTIICRDGKLKGYNTDYYGFKGLLLRNYNGNWSENRALILGTGGTSKTVYHVLKDLGVKEIYKVSRSKSGDGILSYEQACEIHPEIIVNTTPVGMYPSTEYAIPEACRESFYANAKVCVDAVYRPIETAFVKEARKRSIAAEGGLYMLVGQAVYGARLFMNKEIPEKEIDRIYLKMQEYLQGELHISVTENLQGIVSVPPSKSYSHRHLIMAAMADGESILAGVGKSQDIDATINALEQLGASINVLSETDDERCLLVNGRDFLKKEIVEPIFCRESGSTLRFLLPFAFVIGQEVTFSGEESLMKRPMWVYEQLCAEKGITYKKNGNQITVQGRIVPGEYKVAGNVSSQFITGLLFVLPFLADDSCIEIVSPIESLPYIEMTIVTLRQWGIRVSMEGNQIHVPGNQKIEAREVSIEKDASNAAYLFAYKALGHEIDLKGNWKDSKQGDKAFVEIFRQLIEEEHPRIVVKQTPDLVPIAMAVAACCGGAEFVGTRRLQMKESDRGLVMCEELKKFGIRTQIRENSIEVFGGELMAPTVALNGHNDHRIVMALTTLLTKTGGQIKGYQAVDKSFPNYYSVLEACGLKTEKR